MSKISMTIARYFKLNKTYVEFSGIIGKIERSYKSYTSVSYILETEDYWVKAYFDCIDNPFDYIVQQVTNGTIAINKLFADFKDARYNRKEFKEKLTPYWNEILNYIHYLEEEISKCEKIIEECYDKYVSKLYVYDDNGSRRNYENSSEAVVQSILSIPEVKKHIFAFLFQEDDEEDEDENDAE